jgi:hypothetical protein
MSFSIRSLIGIAAGWCVGAVSPVPAIALERVLVRDDGLQSSWNSGGSCSIQYWNTCTGWTWLWGGWSPFDRIGVAYEACGTSLSSLDIFIRPTAPVCPGYGYTASLEAYAADANGCPTGVALGSVAFLPAGPPLLNVAFPSPVAVPSSFVALVRMGSAGGGTARYGADFDAVGPTGPQGCGLCFPTTRVTRSFDYGSTVAPLCPGERIMGPVCDVEWRVTAYMYTQTSVEDTSWSRIKGMYR